MMDDLYDLCIIGAGMFGSAAARHASTDPSLKVCLIGPNEPTKNEFESREIHSSHYDEGRIVHTADRNPALNFLAKKSIARYREIEKLSGIKFYSPVGFLCIGKKNDSYTHNWLRDLETAAAPFVDLSNNDDFKKKFPFINLDADDYPFFDDNGAGHVSPRNMVVAQKKIARIQGCHVIEDVVQQIDYLNTSQIKIVIESGRVLTAKRVLICTGAFTKFKDLNLAKKLKIFVHRETAALLKVSEIETSRLSSMPAILKYVKEIAGMPATTKGAYILPPIQYPDGHHYVKIGPMGHQRNSEVKSLQESVEWYSHKGDPEIMDKLPKLLLQMLPSLKVEEVKGKTCLTCDSPTGLPYIDRLTATVTVAVVGNGTGATICEEVGRMAAQLSITGKWDSELPRSLFEAIMEDE